MPLCETKLVNLLKSIAIMNLFPAEKHNKFCSDNRSFHFAVLNFTIFADCRMIWNIQKQTFWFSFNFSSLLFYCKIRHQISINQIEIKPSGKFWSFVRSAAEYTFFQKMEFCKFWWTCFWVAVWRVVDFLSTTFNCSGSFSSSPQLLYARGLFL